MSLFDELSSRLQALKTRLYKAEAKEYRRNTHPENIAFDQGFNAKMEDEIEFLAELLKKNTDDLK